MIHKTDFIGISLLQINTTVGDLEGNAEAIIAASKRVHTSGAQIAVTPELALTGYPPLDLLFKKHFVDKQLDLLINKVATSVSIPCIIGFVDRDAQGDLYNAAAVIENGCVKAVVRKTLLPTYDVFDELRYFKPAVTSDNEPVEICGIRFGITICEDIWDEDYGEKVVPRLVEAGIKAIINLSSSPFHCGKRELRLNVARRHAVTHRLPVLYCNLVGAQDELIFDGESFVMDGTGCIAAIGRQFKEDTVTIELQKRGSHVDIVRADNRSSAIVPPRCNESELFGALSLGVYDYFRKCGFTQAVIGLSGGIDSAVTACIAADALGAENVICVSMPSRYTSNISVDDARELAQNLATKFIVMAIENSIKLALERYKNVFGDYKQGITIENLQARERGKTLMEIANDLNAIVLATGNKTEYSLGYSTLYGDMCGGLAVIGDVSKPEVYALARFINSCAAREIIPLRTIERAPSAELRDNQVDPFDYDRISPLTDAVVEEHLSSAELVARGYSYDEVELVFRLVRLNEYKRRQAPPILRVTPKAFGIGRKMPIVNRYLY